MTWPNKLFSKKSDLFQKSEIIPKIQNVSKNPIFIFNKSESTKTLQFHFVWTSLWQEEVDIIIGKKDLLNVLLQNTGMIPLLLD